MNEITEKLEKLKELSLEETDELIVALNEAFSTITTPQDGIVDVDAAAQYAEAIELAAGHRAELVKENEAKLEQLAALKEKVNQFTNTDSENDTQNDTGENNAGESDSGEEDTQSDTQDDTGDDSEGDTDGDDSTQDADDASVDGSDEENKEEEPKKFKNSKVRLPDLPSLKQNSKVVQSLEQEERLSQGTYIDARTGSEVPIAGIFNSLKNAAKSLGQSQASKMAGANRKVYVGSIEPSQNLARVEEKTFGNATQANKAFKEILEEKRAKRLSNLRQASGGSCGPCETDYDVNVIGEGQQPVADAFVTVAGNGRCQSFYKDLDFSDYARSSSSEEGSDVSGMFLNDHVGQYTEQDDIDGYGEEGKACYKIPCIDDARNVTTLQTACLEVGNWQELSHPELVEAAKEAADVVYAAEAESWRLRKLYAEAQANQHAITAPAVYSSATSSLLNALLFVKETIKTSSRLSSDPGLNVLLPRYATSQLRVDLANRFSLGLERLSVEQAVYELLNREGIDIHFYDDEIDSTHKGRLDPISNNTFGYWPAEIRAIITRDDTVGRRLEGSLDLGVFRTEEDFKRNNYHLFYEQWESLSFRNKHVYAVDVPFCPSGGTAGTVAPSCSGLTTG